MWSVEYSLTHTVILTHTHTHTHTHTQQQQQQHTKQEVEVLRVKASRVDKLQVELNSLREKLEDASRSQAKLKVRSLLHLSMERYIHTYLRILYPHVYTV